MTSHAAVSVDRRGIAWSSSPDGLTQAEVDARLEAGLVNASDDRTSRTVGEIVRANVLTPFNVILLGCWCVIVIVAGRLGDALFGIVLVLNTLIGIVQEVRAKRDARPPGAAQRAARRVVVRDGDEVEIARRARWCSTT